MDNTPAPAKKPRKPRSDTGKKRGPKYEYFVVNGTTPCRLDRSGILNRRPLLVPCKPGEALEIIGQGAARGPTNRANTMIERTVETIKRIGGNTVFEKTPRMKDALAPYGGLSAAWRVEKRKIAAQTIGTEG